MELKKTETALSTNKNDGAHKGAGIRGVGAHDIGAVADIDIGAVTGGIAVGKAAAGKVATEPANPTAEHEFWRKESVNRPYVTNGTPYEQYGPAYQYGWESFASHKGKDFKEVEPQLEREWESHRGQSKLSWNNVKSATRDAWQRVEKAACSDGCSSS